MLGEKSSGGVRGSGLKGEHGEGEGEMGKGFE